MNNESVAHNFVYEENGRGSNLESENGILYSYSSTLAKKENNVIFISKRISNYSSTSNRHTLHLRRSIPSTMKVICLENVSRYTTLKDLNKTVLNDDFLQPIKDLLVKQSKARVRSYFYAINDLLDQGLFIIENSSIDKRSKEYKEFMILVNSDLESDYKEIIKDHLESEKKAAVKRINVAAVKRLKALQDFTGSDLKGYTKEELYNYDFFKIDDVSIRSNRHVSVELNAAKIIYAAYKAGKNIIGLRIGSYTIINYNEKYVTIGCHKILFKELDRIFKLDNVLKAA